jgi:hypothetical protein
MKFSFSDRVLGFASSRVELRSRMGNVSGLLTARQPKIDIAQFIRSGFENPGQDLDLAERLARRFRDIGSEIQQFGLTRLSPRSRRERIPATHGRRHIRSSAGLVRQRWGADGVCRIEAAITETTSDG